MSDRRAEERSVPTSDGVSGRPSRERTFAHASEAEMGRILDFYAVRWEYEPHIFPILWNTDGDVVESFSPDFWLPDLDLYLEMTTLKQRLVRRKNRKLRRVRELYPEMRVKLFYARDFRALMLKYGKLALAAGLSGSLGQVPPLRPRPIEPELVLEVPDSVAASGPEPQLDPARPAPAEAAAAATATVAGAERRTTRRRRARRRSGVRAVAAPVPRGGP